MRRFHIIFHIADIHAFVRPHTKLLCGKNKRLGIGLMILGILIRDGHLEIML